MFSPKIVSSDAFLDMPISTQALYFHLGMEADDDGFVNPKKTMRMIGVSDDDLKVLVGKRFVLPFENGVVVIKHWLINNMIRKDFYRETVYTEEKKRLQIKENKAYTEIGNKLLTIRQRRIGKDRIGKVSIGNIAEQAPQEIIQVIDAFKEVNPSYKKWYGNTTQRGAITRLISTHSFEKLLKVISLLPQSNKTPFFPSITTPVQLEDKWASLESAFIKKKVELATKKKFIV